MPGDHPRPLPGYYLVSVDSFGDQTWTPTDPPQTASKPKNARIKPEHAFRASPFSEWPIFRSALKDWPEHKARYYYDLFHEVSQLHPTRYKYGNWILAARAWDRRRPEDWKRSQAPIQSFDEIRESLEAKPEVRRHAG